MENFVFIRDKTLMSRLKWKSEKEWSSVGMLSFRFCFLFFPPPPLFFVWDVE